MTMSVPSEIERELVRHDTKRQPYPGNDGKVRINAKAMDMQTCQVSRNFRESPEMGRDLQVSRNCKENTRN